MKNIAILLAFLMTLGSQVGAADVSLPDTKYEVGDCITPTDPDWSWFGASARVEDIVYSKKYQDFIYYLYFPKSAVSMFGFFDIERIDYTTFKLKRCPSSITGS